METVLFSPVCVFEYFIPIGVRRQNKNCAASLDGRIHPMPYGFGLPNGDVGRTDFNRRFAGGIEWDAAVADSGTFARNRGNGDSGIGCSSRSAGDRVPSVGRAGVARALLSSRQESGSGGRSDALG